jgi:hypothetical protein
MTRTLFGALVAALMLAGGASAGGFATVQLDSLPSGTAAGGTWSAELTVLQHGRTPLDGLSPTVTIANGTQERVYPAVAAGRPGVYRVEVVFPSAGTWTWKIWDGFSQTHTYAPVVVAPADRPAGGGVELVWWVAGIAAGAALLAAAFAAASVARRRSRLRTA